MQTLRFTLNCSGSYTARHTYVLYFYLSRVTLNLYLIESEAVNIVASSLWLHETHRKRHPHSVKVERITQGTVLKQSSFNKLVKKPLTTTNIHITLLNTAPPYPSQDNKYCMQERCIIVCNSLKVKRCHPHPVMLVIVLHTSIGNVSPQKFVHTRGISVMPWTVSYVM